jgi:iron complex outermembrane recepter protein
LNKTTLLLGLLGWLATTEAWAQPKPSCQLGLRGCVHASHTHQALAGTVVSLWAADGAARPLLQTVTDSLGDFTLARLCPGPYRLSAQLLGYQPQWVSLTLDTTLAVNLHLSEKSIELQVVTVSAARPVTSAAQPQVSLAGAELVRRQGGTLGQVLQHLTGVSLLQTGPTIAKPIIHGLYANRVLVLNNGIRQEGQQWGNEHAPEIDPLLAGRLTVVKGAATVRYGPDALGGVVLVEPPPLRQLPGLGGQLHLTGASNGRQGTASGSLNGHWRGLGWRLQATGKQGGNVRTPHYHLANTGVQEFNFSGAAGYQGRRRGAEVFFSRFHTQLGILANAHLGNLTDLRAALASPVPVYPGRFANEFTYELQNPQQRVSHNLLKIKANQELNKLGMLYLQYAWQNNHRQEFDVRRGQELTNRPSLDLRLNTQTLDVWLEANRSTRWPSTVGISALFQDNHNRPGTGVRPLVPDYRAAAGGVFWVQRYVRERSELEAGLRYDYRYQSVWRLDQANQLRRPHYQFHNVSATVGGYWAWGQHTAVRSQLSSAWRPPTPNELFSQGLHHGSAALEFGNPTLRSEQALKWTNSLEINTKKWEIELTAYYQHISHYIFLNPRDSLLLTIRGAFPTYDYQQTDARFAGIDGRAKVQLPGGLSLQTKGSLVWARDLRAGAFLPWIPPGRVENALAWQTSPAQGDPPKWFASLVAVTVARQYRWEADRDFAPPPGGYTVFHLEAGGRWPLGKAQRQTLAVQLEVRNLGNLAYRDYLNRFRFFADEMGRNFRLSLHYEFD